MKQPLSNSTASSSAPNNEEQADTTILERDQAWSQFTHEYDHYYKLAWNVAYLIVGNPVEADTIADTVMEKLETQKLPPSKAEIEKHIRVMARWKAIDCYRSPAHKFRERCGPLTENEDGEQYEVDPLSHCSLGAEEEFFNEEERELFAQQFARALEHLKDTQRVCFVLRVVERMKPEEIAEMLNIPPSQVHTHTHRARNRIATILTNWRQKDEKQ